MFIVIFVYRDIGFSFGSSRVIHKPGINVSICLTPKWITSHIK